MKPGEEIKSLNKNDFVPSVQQRLKTNIISCLIVQFSNLRQEYFKPIIGTIPGFEVAPGNIRIQNLMSKVDFKLYKFISKGMDLRTFLTSKYKSRD